jgi:hypothetical protein
MVSAGRMVAPTLATSLFSLSVERNLLGGYGVCHSFFPLVLLNIAGYKIASPSRTYMGCRVCKFLITVRRVKAAVSSDLLPVIARSLLSSYQFCQEIKDHVQIAGVKLKSIT